MLPYDDPEFWDPKVRLPFPAHIPPRAAVRSRLL